jgi:acyl-CoA synthetase (AMP-forming)/AMP-acid ligase II
MPSAPGVATNLGALVGAWAERTPAAPAILAPGRAPLTYAGLLAQVEETTTVLRGLGIGRRDRVALALPNGPEASTAVLAAAIAGVAVPTNPAQTAEEAAAWFAEARIAAVVVPAGADGPAAEAAARVGATLNFLRVDPSEPAGRFRLAEATGSARTDAAAEAPGADDVALLLATSGTTGRPRRAPLTHANLCAGAAAKAASFGLSPDDRCLATTAAFHIYHVGHLLMTLASGGSIVCPPAVDADAVLRLLDEFRPTRMTAVPALLRAILDRVPAPAEVDGGRLRIIHSGAVSLPPSTLTAIEATLRAPVLEGYGLTETAAVLSNNPPPPAPRKAGSVGTATGCEVAIVDGAHRGLPTGEVGEVVVRGPTVFGGYDGDPEATATAFTAGGWFRTGDLGYLDADAYLFLTGRLKEQINRGGTKIDPAEVEAVLLAHPAVAAAAAFAVPHARLGEEVGAAVVLRDGDTAGPGELRAFAAARLAAAKSPRRIAVVERLPTTRTGKPLRVGLAEALGLTTSLRPNPEPGTSGAAAAGAPRTATEAAVVGVWRFLLETDRIGVDDDFFDLGGHSLLVAQLAACLRDGLGVDLPPGAIFAAPTVAAQAARIDAARQHLDSALLAPDSERSLVTLRQGMGRPLFVVPGGRGAAENLFRFAQIARRFAADRPVFGFLAGEVDERDDADRWVDDTAAAYVRELRGRQPAGPHQLLGSCVGGVLALAMGRRLLDAGEPAPHVVLLDTLLPTAARADAAATPRPGPQPAGLRADGRSPRVRRLMRATPRPYPGPITVFANEAWRREDPALGWAPFAEGGLDLRLLPGDHATLLRHDPWTLAALLDPVLAGPDPAPAE